MKKKNWKSIAERFEKENEKLRANWKRQKEKVDEVQGVANKLTLEIFKLKKENKQLQSVVDENIGF